MTRYAVRAAARLSIFSVCVCSVVGSPSRNWYKLVRSGNSICWSFALLSALLSSLGD